MSEPCSSICTKNIQGSGRALSGGSPALTTSAKPCSQCSSASPLRGGQICSTGSVVTLNDVKRSVLLHLCLPDPRLTGEYLAVHLLCVHGRPRSLLRDEPHSRCSQRVNIHYYSRAFAFFFSVNIHDWSFSYHVHLSFQRVLQREGESPISRRLPAPASKTANGGRLTRLRRLDHSGRGT